MEEYQPLRRGKSQACARKDHEMGVAVLAIEIFSKLCVLTHKSKVYYIVKISRLLPHKAKTDVSASVATLPPNFGLFDGPTLVASNANIIGVGSSWQSALGTSKFSFGST